MPRPDKILALHPDPDRQPTNIDRDKYESMKSALLAVIPAEGEGVTFGELDRLVAPRLPEELWAGASIQWYVTTVKLDLEARGLVERVPKSRPQLLLRR